MCVCVCVCVCVCECKGDSEMIEKDGPEWDNVKNTICVGDVGPDCGLIVDMMESTRSIMNSGYGGPSESADAGEVWRNI